MTQIIPTTDPQHYTSLLITSFQLLTSLEQKKDSAILKSHYTTSITRTPDRTSITGSIESFSIQTGGVIVPFESFTVFPILFTAQLTRNKVRFDLIVSSQSNSSILLQCSSPVETALLTIQRDLFIMPLQAGVGTSWQNSVTSTLCTGLFPLGIIDIRAYKIIDETSYNGTTAFVIDRTQKTLSSGEGSQDQHKIVIKGESSGTSRTYADHSTGLLIDLTAETRTTLFIETSGHRQKFLQTSKETVRRN